MRIKELLGLQTEIGTSADEPETGIETEKTLEIEETAELEDAPPQTLREMLSEIIKIMNYQAEVTNRQANLTKRILEGQTHHANLTKQLLRDSNNSIKALQSAKKEIGKKLDQIIHETSYH